MDALIDWSKYQNVSYCTYFSTIKKDSGKYVYLAPKKQLQEVFRIERILFDPPVAG